MAITAAGAAALYRAAANPAGGSVGESGGTPSFGQAMSRAMEQGVELGHGADVAASQALTGQGSVTDVVLAVGRAELALQTAVAVRDRVVGAYQEIMRMPV
ncbi:flagellar hook-basal body complex protein FliE [Humitalea rosea]|uniref:Flagellar hook-basal body complex protein FliE n=1 Tax=Humitalea rosea TaxID=990373 RepID=A0A2W7I536_9PROT|nr:flagellar hook-basal body complex protein FliE [Humitalea rosea]PZW41309.1 flagellar hook-basal body complex protein FliE [Humitalea rosea]